MHSSTKLGWMGRGGEWGVYSWKIDAIKKGVQSPLEISEQRPGDAKLHSQESPKLLQLECVSSAEGTGKPLAAHTAGYLL